MCIVNFRPNALVYYKGKSLNLIKGFSYTIEHNMLSEGNLFLKLKNQDGKYISDDFDGEKFINKEIKLLK